MKRLAFCLFILIVVSCAKQGPYVVVQNESSEISYSISEGISPFTRELTKADAEAVAVKVGSQSLTKSSETKTVKSVIPIYGNEGEVDMYAVNFSNDKGYVILSATKCFYPILVESEEGNYSKDNGNIGLSILIDEFHNQISHCRNLPVDSITNYKDAWLEYEQKCHCNRHVTKSSASDAFITSSIAQWESEGYYVFDLSDGAPSDLPCDIFEQWYELAESLSNQNYDFETNSFILLQRESINSEYGPLISSKWHQDTPYNKSIPYYYGAPVYVGCSPLAVAEVMKYHQWPSNIDWNNMPDVLYSSTTTPLSDFLYEVGRSCGAAYNQGDNGVYINNAVSALHNYGYNCRKVNHSSTTAYQNIAYGRPVIMRGGSVSGGSNNHSWVCDGAKSYTTRETYILKVLSEYEPLEWTSPAIPYQDSESSSNHLHMVWNLLNSGTLTRIPDTWCYDSDSYYDGYYPIDREDIVDIYPVQY